MKLKHLSTCCDAKMNFEILKMDYKTYQKKYYKIMWLDWEFSKDEEWRVNVWTCSKCLKLADYLTFIDDVKTWREYAFRHLTRDEKMSKFWYIF